MSLKVAVLAPLAWQVPPRNYGPWELFCSLLTEGLVSYGLDVTLFASGNSATKAKLESVVPQAFNDNPSLDIKVSESLHIANCFEKANEFDIIHNSFDFVPLTYSTLVKTPVVTTIHGFSNDTILPVYQKYNNNNYYVAISNGSRHPKLSYISTVYHGIETAEYPFQQNPQDYLLFFGRIHPEKGTDLAIKLAQKLDRKLIIAGIIQDQKYFDESVKPFLTDKITFIGAVGGQEKLNLLKNASALLHLISFPEPFGFSLVEAMVCGVPVIAYPLGSIPEVVEDGVSGFIANDFAQALDVTQQINQLDRAKIRKYVENKFSINQMIEGYLKVYKQILNQ